jgi:hypothetical protein
MRIKILISILILSSCSGREHKEYKYIEKYMKTEGLTTADQTPLIISAVSDSDAYLQAYFNSHF